MSIVGVVQKGKYKEIISIGSYYGEDDSDRAEVAFLVREDFQGMGMGGYLLEVLEEIAKENQYKAFTATVMSENVAMIHLFKKHYPDAQIYQYGQESELLMPF